MTDLIQHIYKKGSNVVWSADLTKSKDILELADKIGRYICGIKIHSDIVQDFSMDFINELKHLSSKHNFFIMEDRKFSDIGSTVQKQLNGGHRIAEWADYITVHGIMGEGTIKGLTEGSGKKPKIFLIAQASSEGNMIDSNYTKAMTELAENHYGDIAGFICQERLHPNFIHMTPGVNISSSKDSLGQNYRSPRYLVGEMLTDIVIVGRGIHEAKDPIGETLKYKNEAFQAYLMSDSRRGEYHRKFYGMR